MHPGASVSRAGARRKPPRAVQSARWGDWGAEWALSPSEPTGPACLNEPGKGLRSLGKMFFNF